MYYFPSIIFKYFLTVGTDNPVRLAISFLATPSPMTTRKYAYLSGFTPFVEVS